LHTAVTSKSSSEPDYLRERYVGLGALAVLSTLAGSACAQDLPTRAQRPPPVPPKFKELATKNATAPCLEPPPLPGLAEYEGPMKKTVLREFWPEIARELKLPFREISKQQNQNVGN